MTNTRVIIGLIIVLIGISALFNINLPIFQIAFSLFLIWIGYQIMTGQRGRRFGSDYEHQNEAQEDFIKRVVVFSGINQKLVSDNFSGGEVVAVFGGGEVDLSEVKTKANTIELSVVAVFGGFKVIIPSSWSVRLEGVNILGGIDNKTKTAGKKGTTLVLKGVAIFGGVELVN